jgi:ectoine hydroxylase-related dioxygenase (phytanoyl-CoA dioxygenase family)
MDLARFKAAWDEDGWCVVPGALPVHDLRAAQKAVDHLFPTAEEMDSGVENERTVPWRSTWDAKWPEFPYRSRSLNRLTFHPLLLAMAELFLGTADVRLYMSLITAKYARQSSGYNQLLHADFPNHTILVPQTVERFPQLELFIYLSDVSEANGATRMVSRSRTADIPVEQHTLTFTDYAALYDDPGIAAGPAGSIVAYRPDVYHRSVDVSTPGARRIMMHVSYRPAAAEWGQYQAWAIKGFSPEWHDFVQASGPAELSLVGFPPPGHPYWDEESIARVNARYPRLDMAAWRDALTGPTERETERTVDGRR